MGNVNKMPQGWVHTTLGDISLINPRLDLANFSDDLEISFIPMAAVETESGKVDLTQTRKLGSVKKGYTSFIDGDVIFAKITPCMENGKIAFLSSLKEGIGFGSTEFHVSRPLNDIPRKFIFYFLVQRSYRKDAQGNMTGSAGQLRVPTNFFRDSLIPLPPLREQHRIIAKIEELFSELDKGVEALKAVQQQLKVYRQAVLKWAFAGKLTNKNVLEGTLPEGWKLGTLGEIGKIKGGKRMPPKHYYSENETDYKYIMAGNLKDGTVTNKTIFIERETYDALLNYKVTGGEVYITIVGACIGDAGVIPENIGNAILTENAAKIINLENVYNKYVSRWVNSLQCQRQIKNRILSATLGKLALNRIATLEIPLPPLPEQHAIVAEIESRLSVCEKIEESIEQNLQQAEALRQSILKRAFEGKLVPQDPNDEPASKLLERIKAEKATQTPVQKTRKKKAIL